MAGARGSVVLYNSSLQFAASIPYGAGVSNPQFTNGVLTGGTPITWAGGSSSLAVQWYGGRTAISYAFDGIIPVATANLQVQVQQQNGNWIQAGSGVVLTAPQAASIFVFDAPAGNYRVFSNSGLTIGLNIMMMGIPYGI